jgi:hypothetical protein
MPLAPVHAMTPKRAKRAEETAAGGGTMRRPGGTESEQTEYCAAKRRWV